MRTTGKIQVTDMTGKICLVTGSNSGIGLVTARELARAGARLVMLCRNAERGEAARASIVAATGSTSVELLLGFSSHQFKRSLSGICTLIENSEGLFRYRHFHPELV